MPARVHHTVLNIIDVDDDVRNILEMHESSD